MRDLHRTHGNRAAGELLHGAPDNHAQRLEPAVRNALETRLGSDLGDVRVHSGDDAAGEAHALGALAFTRGRDIFLGDEVGPSDLRVLAHEAAHVIQQTAPGPDGAPVALEAEAQAASVGAATVAGSAPFGTTQKLEEPERPLTDVEIEWARVWLLPSLGTPKSWKEHLGTEQGARVLRLHSGVAHWFSGDPEFQAWKRAGGKPQAVAAAQPAPARAEGEAGAPAGAPGGQSATAGAETAREGGSTTSSQPGDASGEWVPVRSPQIDMTFDESGSRWVVTVDGRQVAAVEVPSRETNVPVNVTVDDKGNVLVEAAGDAQIVSLGGGGRTRGGAVAAGDESAAPETEGFTRSEVSPLLVEGAAPPRAAPPPKSQEQLFKENWARATTPRVKWEASQLGPPPVYYSPEMREIDAPPALFEALDLVLPLPVFTTGWRLPQIVTGETLSGYPVDRAEVAREISRDIVTSIVADAAGGAIIGRLAPVDEVVERAARSGGDIGEDIARKSGTLGDVPPATATPDLPPASAVPETKLVPQPEAPRVDPNQIAPAAATPQVVDAAATPRTSTSTKPAKKRAKRAKQTRREVLEKHLERALKKDKKLRKVRDPLQEDIPSRELSAADLKRDPAAADVIDEAEQRLSAIRGRGEGTAIGSGVERDVVQAWKPRLEADGYTEIYTARGRFKGAESLRRLWGQGGPDLVAVDRKSKRILVGDVTSEFGNVIPAEFGSGTRLHIEKTLEDGRLIASLPEFAGFRIEVQERYWRAGNQSKRIRVRPVGAKP